MMKRWLMFGLLATGLAMFSLGSPSSRSYGKPPKEGKGKGGKGKEGPDAKAGKDLRKAYDAIADVSVQMNNTREKLPPQWTRLLDDAKDFYRTAKNRLDEGDAYRAGELAKAAHDAGRGLRHVLRATLPPVAGLPAPPADAGPPGGKGGPSIAGLREPEAAAAILQLARDRIVAAGIEVSGTGRVFLDASSDVYTQARRAYIDGDYARAAEMARGAEAWTHVPEHVYLGQFEARRAPSERRPPPPPPGPAFNDRSSSRRGTATVASPPPPPLPPR